MLSEFYVMNSFAPITGDLNNDVNFIRTLVALYTYVLNVVFNKTLTINCDYTWNMKESPYDVLIISGAGSTIQGSFDDKDEDKWVVLSENMTFYAQNITLKGFNTLLKIWWRMCLIM